MRFRDGNVLPIAVMALAIAGFVFVVAWAVSPNLKWPWSTNASTNNTNLVACTQEAKLCPDGSYVGRTEPNCAFAKCPATNSNTSANINSTTNTNASNDPTAGWKMYTSKQYGLTFRHPTDWQVNEGELNSPYSIVTSPKVASAQGINTPMLRFWLVNSYDGLQKPTGLTTTSSKIRVAGRDATLTKLIYATNKKIFWAYVNFISQPLGWDERASISLAPDPQGTIDTQLEILSTLSIANPTAGWKTYTNATAGWTIKYPANWKYETGDDTSTDTELIFDGMNEAVITTHEYTGTLDSWLTTEKSQFTGTVGTIQTISVGRQKAYQVPTGINGWTDVGVVSPDGKSFIAFRTTNNTMIKNGMIATFTFTQ